VGWGIEREGEMELVVIYWDYYYCYCLYHKHHDVLLVLCDVRLPSEEAVDVCCTEAEAEVVCCTMKQDVVAVDKGCVAVLAVLDMRDCLCVVASQHTH